MECSIERSNFIVESNHSVRMLIQFNFRVFNWYAITLMWSFLDVVEVCSRQPVKTASLLASFLRVNLILIIISWWDGTFTRSPPQLPVRYLSPGTTLPTWWGFNQSCTRTVCGRGRDRSTFAEPRSSFTTIWQIIIGIIWTNISPEISTVSTLLRYV